ALPARGDVRPALDRGREEGRGRGERDRRGQQAAPHLRGRRQEASAQSMSAIRAVNTTPRLERGFFCMRRVSFVAPRGAFVSYWSEGCIAINLVPHFLRDSE